MAKKKEIKPKKDYKVGYKKPPKEHAFKPGNNMNPHGNNQPKEVLAMKALTEQELSKVIELVMTGTKQEMMEALNSPTISLLHRIVIKAALKAEKDDSFYAVNQILDRGIGTVKQKLDHTSSDGSMSPRSVQVEFVDEDENKPKE